MRIIYQAPLVVLFATLFAGCSFLRSSEDTSDTDQKPSPTITEDKKDSIMTYLEGDWCASYPNKDNPTPCQLKFKKNGETQEVTIIRDCWDPSNAKCGPHASVTLGKRDGDTQYFGVIGGEAAADFGLYSYTFGDEDLEHHGSFLEHETLGPSRLGEEDIKDLSECRYDPDAPESPEKYKKFTIDCYNTDNLSEDDIAEVTEKLELAMEFEKNMNEYMKVESAVDKNEISLDGEWCINPPFGEDTQEYTECNLVYTPDNEKTQEVLVRDCSDDEPDALCSKDTIVVLGKEKDNIQYIGVYGGKDNKTMTILSYILGDTKLSQVSEYNFTNPETIAAPIESEDKCQTADPHMSFTINSAAFKVDCFQTDNLSQSEIDTLQATLDRNSEYKDAVYKYLGRNKTLIDPHLEQPKTTDEEKEEDNPEAEVSTKVSPDVKQNPNGPIEAITATVEGNKVVAHVSGYFPTPCHSIKKYTYDTTGNTIEITFEIQPPSGDVVCTQNLEPFTRDIDLKKPTTSGTYIVRSHGVSSNEFTI